jgi:SAM-dependent methyltransferase
MLTTTIVYPKRARHIADWYQSPAFDTTPIMMDAFSEYAIPTGEKVLDAFCGAGGGLLAAQFAGIDAVGMESNPFLRFVAHAKTRRYPDLPALKSEMETLLKASAGALDKLETDGNLQWLIAGRMPAMPRLQSWISNSVAWKVLALLECIDQFASEQHRDLPLLALASVLRGASHMRLSPHAYGSRESKPYTPVLYHFDAKLRKIIADLEWAEAQESRGEAEVAEGARSLPLGRAKELGPFSLAVAAPPPLGETDPTVQTRLELFFLGYVSSMPELERLNRAASFVEPAGPLHTAHIAPVQTAATQLEERGKSSAGMRHYFDNLAGTLGSIKAMLAPGARLVLNTEDAVHSGLYVPVPDIAAALGHEMGYGSAEVRVRQTRRHPSHRGGLRESLVILRNA